MAEPRTPTTPTPTTPTKPSGVDTSSPNPSPSKSPISPSKLSRLRAAEAAVAALAGGRRRRAHSDSHSATFSLAPALTPAPAPAPATFTTFAPGSTAALPLPHTSTSTQRTLTYEPPPARVSLYAFLGADRSIDHTSLHRMYVAHVDARASSDEVESVAPTGVVQRATKISTDHKADLRETVFCLLLDRDVRRVYDAILALRSDSGSDSELDSDESGDSGIGSESGSDPEAGSIHHARRVDARAMLGLGSARTVCTHRRMLGHTRLVSAPAVLTYAAPLAAVAPTPSVHSSPSSASSPVPSPPSNSSRLPPPSPSPSPSSPPPSAGLANSRTVHVPETPALVVNSPTVDDHGVDLELGDLDEGLPSANTDTFFSAQEDGWMSQQSLVSVQSERESAPHVEEGVASTTEEASSPTSPTLPVSASARSATFHATTSTALASTATTSASPSAISAAGKPTFDGDFNSRPPPPTPAQGIDVPDDVFSDILGAGLSAQNRRARRVRKPISPAATPVLAVSGPPSPSSPSPRSPAKFGRLFEAPVLTRAKLPPDHPFASPLPPIPENPAQAEPEHVLARASRVGPRKAPPTMTPSLIAAEEAEAARRRENLGDCDRRPPLPVHVRQRLSQYPPVTEVSDAMPARRGRSGSDVPLCGWRRRSGNGEEAKRPKGKNTQKGGGRGWSRKKAVDDDAGISAPFNPIHHTHVPAHTDAHSDGRGAAPLTSLPPPPRPRPMPYENAIAAGPQNRMVGGVLHSGPGATPTWAGALRPAPPPPSPSSASIHEPNGAQRQNDAREDGEKENDKENDRPSPAKKRNPLNLTVETRSLLNAEPSPLQPARRVEGPRTPSLTTAEPLVSSAKAVHHYEHSTPAHPAAEDTTGDHCHVDLGEALPVLREDKGPGIPLVAAANTQPLTTAQNNPHTSTATISTGQGSEDPLLPSAKPASPVQRLLAILRLLRLRLRPHRPPSPAFSVSPPVPTAHLYAKHPKPSLWTRIRAAPPIWTLHRAPPAAPTFPYYDSEYEYEFVDYPSPPPPHAYTPI